MQLMRTQWRGLALLATAYLNNFRVGAVLILFAIFLFEFNAKRSAKSIFAQCERCTHEHAWACVLEKLAKWRPWCANQTVYKGSSFIIATFLTRHRESLSCVCPLSNPIHDSFYRRENMIIDLDGTSSAASLPPPRPCTCPPHLLHFSSIHYRFSPDVFLFFCMALRVGTWHSGCMAF